MQGVPSCGYRTVPSAEAVEFNDVHGYVSDDGLELTLRSMDETGRLRFVPGEDRVLEIQIRFPDLMSISALAAFAGQAMMSLHEHARVMTRILEEESGRPTSLDDPDEVARTAQEATRTPRTAKKRRRRVR